VPTIVCHFPHSKFRSPNKLLGRDTSPKCFFFIRPPNSQSALLSGQIRGSANSQFQSKPAKRLSLFPSCNIAKGSRSRLWSFQLEFKIQYLQKNHVQISQILIYRDIGHVSKRTFGCKGVCVVFLVTNKTIEVLRACIVPLHLGCIRCIV
jgi:hypothetical protein